MRFRWFKIVAGLAASLAGCSSSTTPEGADLSRKAESLSRQKFGGVEFVMPAGWTKESVGDGLLLTTPEIKNNWQANLFLEVREDAKSRPLEQALADLVPNLKERKESFREVSRKVENHSIGFRFGRIEYTCSEKGGTALTEWEIVIELDGKKRLFVLASSASAAWDKYQPLFQEFVASLRKSRI